MYDWNYIVCIYIILFFSVINCAKKASPTGGPKDTIPPVLISASPKLNTTFFDKEEVKFIKSVGLKSNQVTHVSGDDNTLKNLYQSAEALVYPSLYEGFGMPPLEAMANGCPVVSSNTSSMPEVIGDAAEYFNPESVEELLSAIENVLSSNRKEELVNLGFKRVKMFSWKKCAKETLSVYQRL